MPYIIETDDTFISVTLNSPLTPADISGLQQAFKGHFEASEPVKAILDIVQCDISDLMSVALNHLDEILPPNFSYHLQYSRLAVITRNEALKTMMALLPTAPENFESVQVFKTRKQAVDWLTSQ